jgi:Spy/CpxP family protein refolding chaperone
VLSSVETFFLVERLLSAQAIECNQVKPFPSENHQMERYPNIHSQRRQIMVARLAVVFFAAFIVSAQAIAQDRGPMQRQGRMMERLNLTEQQQKQFDALASDFRKQAVDRRAEIAKARIELMDLLKADTPDQKKISSQITNIANLEAAAKEQALDHWFQVNKILTPEQQKIWKRGLVTMAQMQMSRGMMRGGRWQGRQMERPERAEPMPR